MKILLKLILLVLFLSFYQCKEEKKSNIKKKEISSKKKSIKKTLEKEVIKPWDSLNKDNV